MPQQPTRQPTTGPGGPHPEPSATDIECIMTSLNPAQLQAVRHEPTIPLQILAGPGSGKTKVLTARIAHLILTHKLLPTSICAVTFTNKAANEMRERLTKLIGKQKTTSLQMGTFHSLCARFLRMHSKSVGLEENFTICDADESKKLVMALLKPYKEYMVENDITLTEGSAASIISKAKAKGKSAAMFFKEMEETEPRRFLKRGDPQPKSDKGIERIIAEVYIGYEQVLKDNNALDFDDLLIYGVKLFSSHEESVLWCRHILVDEFQDTNTMQYELMKAIGIRKCLTIVGDPDQSIYGWRSAEVVNLSRMRKDFPATQQVFLEQNYRSTAAILRSCLAIVAEDKKRIPKSLHTSHPLGATPFVGQFEDDKQEADFIAYEIKRTVANMGGVLKWGDFVVLLRYNALSRNVENSLQKQGIPCRILGGHKFFERMEVKDIISYLQLVDNPDFNPAFIRSVKAPPRGAGDKSLAEIASQAEKLKLSQLQFVERIHDNKTPDTKPPIKKKVASLVKVIRALRKLDEERTSPSEMIKQLVDMINYEDYLKKTQQDWESRWENVQELITFASEVESQPSAPNPTPVYEMDDADASNQPSLLRQFLQSSMLSSEGDNQTEEESQEKVTLSTCHAAKGLEWPVVIVPSVDKDTFPFYRTEDVDEERRLLYVACTRAQALLYIVHARQRMVGGKKKEKRLSEFVSVVKGKNEGFFSHDVPRFLPADRAVISGVLNRPVPDEEDVRRRLDELEMVGDRVQPTYRTARGEFSTVSLTGVKSVVFNAPMDGVQLSAHYAAPDALASISASFLKDYKSKAPFSKGANPFLRPVVIQNSFTPASSGTYSLSIGSAITTFIPVADAPSAEINAHRAAQNVTSRQESRNTALNRQPSSRQTIGTVFHPSNFSLSPPSAPRTAENRTPLSLSLTTSGPSSPMTSSAVPLSTKSYTSVRASQRSTSNTSPSVMSFQYDENHPPGESSSRPMTIASSKNQTAFPRVSYDTTPLESSSPMEVSSPQKETKNSSPYAVSDLPTTTNNRPRTQMLNSSQATPPSAPQTAGVKRRLGMGRTSNGYSNKKFKPPV